LPSPLIDFRNEDMYSILSRAFELLLVLTLRRSKEYNMEILFSLTTFASKGVGNILTIIGFIRESFSFSRPTSYCTSSSLQKVLSIIPLFRPLYYQQLGSILFRVEMTRQSIKIYEILFYYLLLLL
jgi:hypothetical protein